MYRLAQLAKYRAFLVVAFALSLGLLLNVGAANGQAGVPPTDPFGVNKTEKALEDTIGGGQTDAIQVVSNIINIALGLLGIVAVVIILIGGFKWMTAGGSDEKVGEARKLIFSGIIGIAIILSAWAIAKFVISSLGGAIDVDV